MTFKKLGIHILHLARWNSQDSKALLVELHRYLRILCALTQKSKASIFRGVPPCYEVADFSLALRVRTRLSVAPRIPVLCRDQLTALRSSHRCSKGIDDMHGVPRSRATFAILHRRFPRSTVRIRRSELFGGHCRLIVDNLTRHNIRPELHVQNMEEVRYSKVVASRALVCGRVVSLLKLRYLIHFWSLVTTPKHPPTGRSPAILSTSTRL